MTTAVALTDVYRPAQIKLIARTAAADCNAVEFDQFMHVAAQLRLDPLRKQIYAFVFNKDKEDLRRMAIVVGIDGFRAVAKRSGNYRPDTRPPRYTIDESLIDPDSNPLGLVSAEVSCFQYAHGGWHEVAAVAYWEEFAPIVDSEWQDRRKVPCKPKLDPKKDNWRKMPRIMLAKCAEAQAIRRGWPEDLAAVYDDSELDRSRTLDLTATEIVAQELADQRAKMTGADNMFLSFNGEIPEGGIPLGRVTDTVMAHLMGKQAHEIVQWKNENKALLPVYWARLPNEYLEVKKILEAAQKKVDAEEAA
jgi:phage recombination protein Bet